ncbi:MAG: NAD-dependent epimerase/dehydratase family protein [Candidatus Hodarchaeales archaeon]|jgi:nucleoside-diphosphate-sugar epimerase
MKVLITGATGQVGRFLVRTFLNDENFSNSTLRLLFRDISKIPAEIDRDRLELYPGDLKEMSLKDYEWLIEGVDAVVHLAAIFNMYQPFDEEMKETNVEGTTKLLDSFTSGDGRIFVHCSSIVAYGFSGSPVKTEKTPLTPSYGYGRSKQESDKIAMKYQEMTRMEKNGKSIIILRPAGIISSEDKMALPLVTKFAKFRMKLKPSMTFPMVHVQDLVNVILKLLVEKEVKNEIYNVCSYQPGINELGEILAAEYGDRGYKKPLIPVPVWAISLLKPLIKMGFKFKKPGPDSIIPPLFLDALGKMGKDYHVETEKIEKELDFHPVYENVREAIKSCM